MNTHAFKNIDILSSLNENDKISFNGYELIKEKNYNLKDFEYGLYFTFNELLTLVDNNTRSRDRIIEDMNNSIDNLYDNEYFNDIINNNENIKDVMEEICTKVDIITEKYFHKSFCRVITEEVYRQSLLIMRSIVYPKRVFLSENNEEGFIIEENNNNDSKED